MSAVRVTRILLTASDVLYLDTLTGMLNRESDLRVAGATTDGRESLKLFHALNPDVVVAESFLPSLSGWEVARRLARAGQRAGVILVSSEYDLRLEDAARNVGAQAYFHHGQHFQDLCRMIRRVAGEKMSRSIQIGKSYGLAAAMRPSRSTPELTDREVEVVQLIAEGKTTRDISALLGITYKTADHYRSRVMDKLGMHDVASLTRFAVRSLLIRP